MIKILFFILFVLPVSLVSASEDEWDIGEARSHSLDIHSGFGEEFSKGANLVLILPAMSELNVDYLRSNFPVDSESIDSEKESFEKYSISFSTDPAAVWSVQLDYSYSGNSGSLETEDTGVGIQFYPDNWLLRARYSSGDVEIFARREAVDTGLIASRRLQLDRNASELTFQYFQQSWVWSISAIDYSYSRDINLSPDSLRAQQVLGASSFQQLFGLLDWYVAVEAGYQSGDHFWRFGYADYALEVSADKGKSPYASWDYQLSDKVSLGFLAAVGLNQSDHYGEASLRFYF